MIQKGNVSSGPIRSDAFRVTSFRSRFLFAAITCLAILCPNAPLAAEQFQLSLVGGSVITVDVEGQEIEWTDVEANGEMTRKNLALSNIKQLILSLSPASKQVAEIRRLLSQLESPNYVERQQAEATLSNSEMGGRFKSLIKTQVDHKKLEVRYRIDRILTRLDSDTQQTSNEFDKLTLKEGSFIEGDAGDFQVNCTYRGRQMTFPRSAIRMISEPSKTNQTSDKESEVKVRMFHDHVGNFDLPNQIKVDFEQAPNGAELAKFTDVSELFTPVGLRLGAEKKGTVVVSGFPFRFAPLPPAANSVCVYESLGSYSKRFKGVMKISFCMPNQNSVPAGVHEFGLFLGRVNHSRDFLLEAYNADGQLLAAVEATDRPCIFAGVKSTEPIAKIRLLSNPYLYRVDRIIDEDYAVDNIRFSPPVPIVNPSDSEPGIVRLKNGDLLKGEKIVITDEASVSIQLEKSEPFIVELDKLESIRFNRAKVAENESSFFAALPDRSVLLVQPASSFKSLMFGHLDFKPDELMALWSAKNAARFPEATDFDNAKKVMVFPTCRIATDDVTFSPSGFAWEKGRKIEQPIHTTDEEDGDDDPTPSMTSIDYAETISDDIPTIWFTPPKAQAAGTGQIRLTDGQQLVLGGGNGFELVELKKGSATISVAGKETEIPWGKILSITFPATQ